MATADVLDAVKVRAVSYAAIADKEDAMVDFLMWIAASEEILCHYAAIV